MCTYWIRECIGQYRLMWCTPVVNGMLSLSSCTVNSGIETTHPDFGGRAEWVC